MQGTAQLVTVVGQLVGEEYRQIRGVGGRVAELSDELDTMNAILRMLSDAEDGAVDHFIRVWMNQVRELSYDAQDCVHLYVFRIRCRPRDLWSKTKGIFTTIFTRRRLACEIKALRTRAIVIGERHARYGVSREAILRITASSSPAPVPVFGHALGRPAANNPDDLVGIDKQANILADMVALSDSESDMKLKVFSVVGFGGLGKTTLAIRVCQQLENKFQRQAQVSVSQAFRGTKDLEGFLKRVLQQIVKPKVDNPEGIKEENQLQGIDKMGVDELTDKLKELLKDARYLIMVDDVWTIGAWDSIRSNLPDCNNGSRIIVTTRMETVAEACSDTKSCIYQIKPLGTKDSKILFLSRVFGSKVETLPINLNAEMGRILKKCGGLPMAIISIASILASYTSSESKDMWERVCKSIGSHLESNPTLEGMRRIVTLSFNHLHYYLKGCMMYLSIFPEDYVIVKDRLLKRWIAEGLVAGIRGLTLMEVAESYYNELVSRSMIVRADGIVSWYDGRMETCQVHDMMLEVMVSKSLESNFVSLIGGSFEGMSYGSIRRLSIHGGEAVVSPSNKTTVSHGRKNGIEGMKMKHVRSLSIFDLEGHMKVLDRLGEFSLLRVLDLEDCIGMENKHLRHVCQMYLLRFLSLKGTGISEMPSEVSELENLETLDVRETYLKDLPETVTKLEKLEHLQINNKDDLYLKCWIARKGLGRMKALRTLNVVVFGCDDAAADAAEELGELQELRELRMTVDLSDPLHLDIGQKLAKSLGKLYSLRWLNVTGRIREGHALDFLHKVDPPPRLLQYLRFGSKINKLPDWIGSLNNLVDLFIAWTYLHGDQLYGPVCELPSLKRVYLEAYYYTDPVLVAKTAHSFPALKELSLNFDIEGMEVLRFEENTMESLEILHVRFLDRDSKEVFGIEHLASLKEAQLKGKKDNPALHRAVEQVKKINEKRQESKQIKVVVIYE